MSDFLVKAAAPTRSLDRFEVERLLDRVDFCDWHEGVDVAEAYAALTSFLKSAVATPVVPALEEGGDDPSDLDTITVGASKIRAFLGLIDDRRDWNQDLYDRLCTYLYDRINAAKAPDQVGLKGPTA